MIIYDGEGDFTSENIPAEYLREDALPPNPILRRRLIPGTWPDPLKGALFPKKRCNKVFFKADTGPDWIFSVEE